MLAREAVDVPGPAADRLGEIAAKHGVWLVTGVNEVDAERPGTLYNTLLYHAPDGRARAEAPQARPDEPRAARLGPGRRRRPARDRDRARAHRRTDLLGELHAARSLRALRVGGRDLHRLDGGRRRALAGDARPHRPRVALLRGRAVRTSSARRSYPDDFPLRELIDGQGLHRPRRQRHPRPRRLLPGRAAVRRGGDPLRDWIRSGSWRSASASTRPGTTTGPTCSSSRYARTREGLAGRRLSRRAALDAPMRRPQSRPYDTDTNAPCVLAL